MIDLFSIAENALQGLSSDFELVDVEILPAGVLRVTIDKVSGISIDDCEKVSRHLSHVFTVENVNYSNLEVSSPGIDRPLRKFSDFLRFIGERVEIKFHNALNGRKIFRGVLFLKSDLPYEYKVNEADYCDITFGINIDSLDDKKNIQTIDFVLNDVDRAKLDPIIDFKGKWR
ncbi:MAG: ribosome maturation factor RimP [Candidatus Kinetoplastibacterium crithidii]|nr:MAG: ribosome maturation factor RimP [Candidatus Kinetoplastibacterium crithidii]